MEELVKTILLSMSSLKLPQVKIMTTLLCGFCFYQGRSNMTNMARFVAASRKTLWNWSRQIFDYAEFNKQIVLNLKDYESHGYVAAIDASFIRKSGKATPEVGYFYNGCASRAEKGLEISCIALIDRTLNTAFSLDVRQSKAPISKVDKTEGQDTSITHALEALKAQISTFKLMSVTSIVADGWYAKKSFICGVAGLELHTVSKLRSDANLKYIYTGVYSGRGRPRQFGEKVNLRELIDFEIIKLDNSLVGYVKEVYSVAFKINIKVVVLRSEGKDKNMAIFFSTNTNESAEEIVSIYRSRFQIEFLFRDAKQFCGLEDCQARNATALHNHFNNSLTAVNLMKYEELQMGQAQSQQVISIASARRRKSNQFVAEAIFSKLDLKLSCSKIAEIMDYIENISNIAA
jgi:hypothetical protein